MTRTFSFNSKDALEIITYVWEPDNKTNVKGVVQIVHGSIEHALRYDDFAKELNKEGYVVYANDQRGHGKTAKSKDDLSYFSDMNNGWELAIYDLYTITKRIKMDYPNLPIFLFGHSMGSFLVRDYASAFGNNINGIIISGTSGKNILLPIVKHMALKEMKKNGRKSRSRKLHDFVYGTLNKKIKNPKTSCDFISRDENEVNKYVNDPLCGYICTAEYIYEMIKGTIKVNNTACFNNTPNSVKVLIISGNTDPVGGTKGKGVKKVYNAYIKAGIKDVQIKLYKDARHEVLNELNKYEVYSDIKQWLNSQQ